MFHVFTCGTRDSAIIALERKIFVDRWLFHQVDLQTHCFSLWFYDAARFQAQRSWWILIDVIRLDSLVSWWVSHVERTSFIRSPFVLAWTHPQSDLIDVVVSRVILLHLSAFWIGGGAGNTLTNVAAEGFFGLRPSLSFGWPTGNWMRKRVRWLRGGWQGGRVLLSGLKRVEV